MNKNRRAGLKGIWAMTALAMAALAAMPAAAQQAWPSKPVRIVVPFAPGGSTDVVARMIGQKLSAI